MKALFVATFLISFFTIAYLKNENSKLKWRIETHDIIAKHNEKKHL
jgi:hypothetical protein